MDKLDCIIRKLRPVKEQRREGPGSRKTIHLMRSTEGLTGYDIMGSNILGNCELQIKCLHYKLLWTWCLLMAEM